MNIGDIVEALRTTLVGDRKDAVDYLKQTSKLIGFPQILLDLANSDQVDCEVRQAAVIYLKNLIHSHWEIDKSINGIEQESSFELSEQDKNPIRHKIIGFILSASGPIQYIF